jgi:hypothetical protein
MRDTIANAALALIGTPFHDHGRHPPHGVDCIGVIEQCLNQAGFEIIAPSDYRRQGDHAKRIVAFFADERFGKACDGPQTGDIAVAQITSRQFHFMIRVPQGWVHAHAGLGKVVQTPDPIDWPLLGIWRVKGF